MPGILTLTLNPALDLSTSAVEIVPGPKLRCARPQVDPGGGGVNVSRAIRILGGHSLAMVALGGATGQRLRSLLDAEGVTSARFEIADETRQSFSITDEVTKDQWRFVTPGPEWTEAETTGFLALVAKFLRGREIIVLSGSLPDGVRPEFTAALNDLGATVSARLAADISGPALIHVTENPTGLWLLRMDRAEAEKVKGAPLMTREDTAEFAAELVGKGVAEKIVIGRGEDGSTMATKNGCIHCFCPAKEVNSPIGAGDSLMGAMVLAYFRGMSDEDALRAGVAAASAAVLTSATELCRAEDYHRLLPLAELIQL